ncbi:MAG: type II toxin-antitoxin system RelE/ParE family toxin [Nanoarchaeota archaeon]|nr:type II toxin-antitoxin system RelE/ParE family toxin [Nanoarchaeota archaeon]
MNLPSKVKFFDEKLKKAFEELQKGKGEEKKLYEWLERAFKDIEENAFCGIQVPKKIIPREYIQKYKIHNLWKYNLPNSWRLLYSIENQDIIVVSIILEWMNHKDYERRFGY